MSKRVQNQHVYQQLVAFVDQHRKVTLNDYIQHQKHLRVPVSHHERQAIMAMLIRENDLLVLPKLRRDGQYHTELQSKK